VNETLYLPPDASQIISVVTYPVKSLPGVLRLGGAKVTENGLEGDRIFTLAGIAPSTDAIAPRLTLREQPELARIATAYTTEGVTLTAEGVGTLLLPYGVEEGDKVRVKSWGGEVTGVHINKDADDWLGTFLKRNDVQILAVPDSCRRTLAPDEKNEAAPEFTGRATDGYPLHIVSLASLRRLNEVRGQLGLAAIGIERFRANIIIDGVDLLPFAEDTMAGMRFEDDASVVDALTIEECKRCATVEADPDTGEREGDVLKSLAALEPERNTKAKLVFGAWAAPSKISVGGILRAGQLLSPLS